MINIDYNVDPQDLISNVTTPIQGGLDPSVLLSNKENLNAKVNEIFRNF